MPSWNIHIAHVERLLERDGAEALGVRDANAFLFGNLVPDIYVGYLVSPITKKIPYRRTHFADPGYVPQPAYWEFWEKYARPSADASGQVSDVVLGAWMHLLADNVYNAYNNRYIAERGIAPGEETRKRKQADFALFGRTLDIHAELCADEELLAQAAAFPQYAIAEPDARGAVAVANDVVRENGREHVDGTPDYCMLSGRFFSSTFARVDYLMERNLKAYARHGALGCGDYGSDGNA